MGDVVFRVIDPRSTKRTLVVEPTLLKRTSDERPLLTATQVVELAGVRSVRLLKRNDHPRLIEIAENMLRARGVVKVL